MRCSIKCLDEWFRKESTEPRLMQCLVAYAKGRDSWMMISITGDWGQWFHTLAPGSIPGCHIGWRRFMEGMISEEIIDIQADYMQGVDSRLALKPWARGHIVKLPEATHGQWLYQNVQVHASASGTLATKKKRRYRDG